MPYTAICGFEVGDLGETQSTNGTVAIEETTVRTGAYAVRCNPTGTGVGSFALRNTADDTDDDLAIRCYFRYATKPATDPSQERIILLRRGNGSSNHLILYLDNAGHINVHSSADNLLQSGTTVLAVDTWYLIDLVLQANEAGGPNNAIYELWIDGVSEFGEITENLGVNDNCGEVSFGKVFDVSGETVDLFFDDIAMETGRTTKIGAGQIIARQPDGAGADTDWTGGGDASGAWDETPSDGVTTEESSNTDTTEETAALAAFSATQSGHGSEVIGSGDTLNSASVVAAMKRGNGSGTTHSIRRRINSNVTDLAHVTGTGYGVTETGDASTAPWTTDLTLTNLDGMEAGGARGVGGREFFISTVWVMVDYTPATGAPEGAAAWLAQYRDRARSGQRGPVNTAGLIPPCHDEGEILV